MHDPFWIGEAYHVEPSLNRVTGPNGVTRLEPKVMQVLVCLTDHAGQMVPKDRLLGAAWADTAVTDDVLTRAISELRRLLDDDPRTSRVIETIPKAGYRLIAQVERQPSPAAAVAAVSAAQTAGEARPDTPAVLPRRRRGSAAIVASVVGLGVLVTGSAWWLRSSRDSAPAPVRIVPLTVLPGREMWPTFSPDGDQVAFEWAGEKGENFDIYITMVGSSEVRRLTTDGGGDRAPRWSPDGRQIAYLRADPELAATPGARFAPGGHIHLISPLGGLDRKLSETPVAAPFAWSPDGRYLAAPRVVEPTGIYLVPVDGGELHPLVQSKRPFGDSAPAFSPDGRRLAYRSCQTPPLGCDVYVLALDAALAPASAPRRLTPSAVPLIGSLTWSRDGRSVIYNSLTPLITYLWRADADGTRPPERVEVAGLGATMPAVAASRNRLAFVRVVVDTDVYRFEAGRSSVPVLTSSFLEAETRFSPDGGRVAFASMRSGDAFRIWISAADGSNPHQLTDRPGLTQGSPWWSPDGRRLAFDAMGEDLRTHIWMVDADGGRMQQLTTDPGDQNVPYWSRDGRWVYFSADRGAGRDIWRVPATGGPSQPVTQGGSGRFACESPDGQNLLYQPHDGESPLLALPLTGGSVWQVVKCVKPSAFASGREGVYYVACDPSPDPELHLLNPATGRDRVLGRLEKYDYQFESLGLAVSHDGRSVLYPRRILDSWDLMVIENFR